MLRLKCRSKLGRIESVILVGFLSARIGTQVNASLFCIRTSMSGWMTSRKTTRCITINPNYKAMVTKPAHHNMASQGSSFLRSFLVLIPICFLTLLLGADNPDGAAVPAGATSDGNTPYISYGILVGIALLVCVLLHRTSRPACLDHSDDSIGSPVDIPESSSHSEP